MSEAVAAAAPARAEGTRALSVRIGWRNLWRNRRRTGLTSGGIAFAVLLVMLFMALQYGQYAIMEDSATTLIAGHVQVQARAYLADERFEDTIPDVTGLVRAIEATPHVVAVAPRVEAFALVSAEERSFGAQVLGIDVNAESRAVRFSAMLGEGRGIEGESETVIGVALARNLGAAVGDEVVVLGSGKEGGVAALALTVVGLLETGMADLDRAMMLAPIRTVQEGFGLGDEAHMLAVRLDEIGNTGTVVNALRGTVPPELRVRGWQEVLPELQQAIEVDKIGGQIMYVIIMVLVVFSVVNSFIMTVFERTREFGMMLAIGMRARVIVAMVMWEAFFLWLLGTAMALAIAVPLIVWLADVGIYLGAEMEEYARQFYMPSRIYPALTATVLLAAPLVMLLGTQLAALLPSLRIRRLQPVVALRES